MTAGLRVLEGPVVAGVGPGDVVVVDEGELFSVALTPRGIDLTPSPRVPVPHAVLLRFVDGGWREEGGGEVKPVVAKEVVVDAWRFELVDDAGVVDTVRRFAADRYVVVRPRRVFHANTSTSWWTALHDDGRVQDVVWSDSARLVPLCRGVPLERLAGAGVVDDGIARAIVQQSARGRPVVCWDGIVRAIDTRPLRNEDRRAAFADLVGMKPVPTDEQAHALWWQQVMDRYQRTRAATVVDVAAFVRSFDAAGYARHVAVLEELELWRLADARERDQSAG